MGRAGPGKARGGEGLVLDKRPGTGLELDVGEGKPLAPLRLSRLGASGSKPRPHLARGGGGGVQGDQKVSGACDQIEGPRVGDPKAGLPQTTPCISVFVFGGDL